MKDTLEHFGENYGKQHVQAAEVAITFGLESYEQEVHENFLLSVFINCDSPAENY